MYKLEDIFDQAFSDKASAKLINNGYQSISLLGVKLIKDDYTHEIQILNTNRSMYAPISEDHMDLFKKYGWKCGVFEVTLYNYRLKLKAIESRIRDEVNDKNSSKKVKQLWTLRDDLMSNYNKLNNKLNDNKKERDNI